VAGRRALRGAPRVVPHHCPCVKGTLDGGCHVNTRPRRIVPSRFADRAGFRIDAGAACDYRATCHELLGFCRDVLNAQLDMLRASIAIAESVRQRQATINRLEREARLWTR
jgi:hypothetical protein